MSKANSGSRSIFLRSTVVLLCSKASDCHVPVTCPFTSSLHFPPWGGGLLQTFGLPWLSCVYCLTGGEVMWVVTWSERAEQECSNARTRTLKILEYKNGSLDFSATWNDDNNYITPRNRRETLEFNVISIAKNRKMPLRDSLRNWSPILICERHQMQFMCLELIGYKNSFVWHSDNKSIIGRMSCGQEAYIFLSFRTSTASHRRIHYPLFLSAWSSGSRASCVGYRGKLWNFTFARKNNSGCRCHRDRPRERAKQSPAKLEALQWHQLHATNLASTSHEWFWQICSSVGTQTSHRGKSCTPSQPYIHYIHGGLYPSQLVSCVLAPSIHLGGKIYSPQRETDGSSGRNRWKGGQEAHIALPPDGCENWPIKRRYANPFIPPSLSMCWEEKVEWTQKAKANAKQSRRKKI